MAIDYNIKDTYNVIKKTAAAAGLVAMLGLSNCSYNNQDNSEELLRKYHDPTPVSIDKDCQHQLRKVYEEFKQEYLEKQNKKD